MAKKIGMVSNNQKEKAIETAKEIHDFLVKKGCSVSLLEKDVMPSKYSLSSMGDKEFEEKVDYIISVGGDGTFLRAAKYAFKREVPIMGVNMGNLGFLAEIEIKKLYTALENLLKEKFIIENRMLIEGRIIRNGKELEKRCLPYVALNEFVVTRSMTEKIIKISLTANGYPVSEFGADGVIISTPTGSTAYSLSAGGPVVEPTNEVLIITPICPHTLYNRSIIFDPDTKIEVRIGSKNKENSLSIDGVKNPRNLINGDILRVSKSKLRIRLISFNQNIFFKVFKEKLLERD
ncbi:MAG: NAD(+)/NADH kinase [Candidatus Humimicrobiaceae bacterium]